MFVWLSRHPKKDPLDKQKRHGKVSKTISTIASLNCSLRPFLCVNLHLWCLKVAEVKKVVVAVRCSLFNTSLMNFKVLHMIPLFIHSYSKLLI